MAGRQSYVDRFLYCKHTKDTVRIRCSLNGVVTCEKWKKCEHFERRATCTMRVVARTLQEKMKRQREAKMKRNTSLMDRLLAAVRR